MFQTDLVRPGTRAWLVALALASWCAGAEPSNSLPQPPCAGTSPGPALPRRSAADEAGHPARPGLNSPSPTAIPGAGPSIAPEPPDATRTDARPARRPSLLRPPDATFPAPDA